MTALLLCLVGACAVLVALAYLVLLASFLLADVRYYERETGLGRHPIGADEFRTAAP